MKKAYRKPTIFSEATFETSALACGKSKGQLLYSRVSGSRQVVNPGPTFLIVPQLMGVHPCSSEVSRAFSGLIPPPALVRSWP